MSIAKIHAPLPNTIALLAMPMDSGKAK